LQVGEQVVSIALKTFSRIDGLIINHGTLGDVKRISDSTAEEWRSLFDVNFFSAVSLVSQYDSGGPLVHATLHD
jgi:NAD(P)-dependent dehydrogenase (short-subunit alcohol dehydrogenase family)